MEIIPGAPDFGLDVPRPLEISPSDFAFSLRGVIPEGDYKIYLLVGFRIPSPQQKKEGYRDPYIPLVYKMDSGTTSMYPGFYIFSKNENLSSKRHLLSFLGEDSHSKSFGDGLRSLKSLREIYNSALHLSPWVEKMSRKHKPYLERLEGIFSFLGYKSKSPSLKVISTTVFPKTGRPDPASFTYKINFENPGGNSGSIYFDFDGRSPGRAGFEVKGGLRENFVNVLSPQSLEQLSNSISEIRRIHELMVASHTFWERGGIDSFGRSPARDFYIHGLSRLPSHFQGFDT